MNNQNNESMQGQAMNHSPMEEARQKSAQGFNQNPYINSNNQNMGAAQMNQNPYYNNAMSNNNAMPKQMSGQGNNDSLLGSFDTSNFIKGALVGAVGAYLLTNENAQKTIFKNIAKGTEMFQAGIEEMKERFEDAKAEMDAER